ncbi:Jerky-like protein, partial [Stegodyphus mimosarum]
MLMDQGAIMSVKRKCSSAMLHKLIEKDHDLKTFLKKFLIVDGIYEDAATWQKVKLLMLIKTWRKIFLDFIEYESFLFLIQRHHQLILLKLQTVCLVVKTKKTFMKGWNMIATSFKIHIDEHTVIHAKREEISSDNTGKEVGAVY